MTKTQDQTALLIARKLDISKLKSQKEEIKSATRKGKTVVYGYLDEDGKPYYIGIGKNASRPYSRDHNVSLPSDDRLIRKFGAFADRKSAGEREKALISRYGRESRGGILGNRAKGGGSGGASGMVSADVAKRYGLSVSKWENLSENDRRIVLKRYQSGWRGERLLEGLGGDLPSRVVIVANSLGVDPVVYASLSAKKKNVVRTRYRRGLRGADLLKEERGNAVRSSDAAKRLGISQADWDGLDVKARHAVAERFKAGIRGDELIGGYKSGYTRAAIKAAERLGIDIDIWANKLTALERKRVLARYTAGKRGAALLEGLL